MIQWLSSLDALPIWKLTDAHVYWKQDGWKHLQMNDYMVSSIQVTGTCWLHASVVLQHILVVKATGIADHEKVAIQRFLAIHKERHAYFLLNRGGNSIEVLKAITEKPRLQLEGCTIPTRRGLLAIAQYVADAFDIYGPGLVSEFKVDDSFKSCKKSSYLNDQINPLGKPEKHSMLLIGFRPSLRPSILIIIFVGVTILHRPVMRLRFSASELVAGYVVIGGVCAALGTIECAHQLCDGAVDEHS